MGVFRFFHNLYGYHSKHKTRHAMLCVLEAHLEEYPHEWKHVDINAKNGSRYSNFGWWNEDKKCFLPDDGGVQFKTNYGAWEFIDLPKLWEIRLIIDGRRRRLFEQERKEQEEHLRKLTALRNEHERDKEKVDLFRSPKLSEVVPTENELLQALDRKVKRHVRRSRQYL